MASSIELEEQKVKERLANLFTELSFEGTLRSPTSFKSSLLLRDYIYQLYAGRLEHMAAASRAKDMGQRVSTLVSGLSAIQDEYIRMTLLRNGPVLDAFFTNADVTTRFGWLRVEESTESEIA